MKPSKSANRQCSLQAVAARPANGEFGAVFDRTKAGAGRGHYGAVCLIGKESMTSSEQRFLRPDAAAMSRYSVPMEGHDRGRAATQPSDACHWRPCVGRRFL